MKQMLEFSVAPMMRWTDHDCRFFHRLITKNSYLYSEIITADAIIYGPTDELLQSNKLDNKTIIQIGGSNRVNMAKASRIIQERGYQEVNINLGCPSNRVQAGNFGACLMENPTLLMMVIP